LTIGIDSKKKRRRKGKLTEDSPSRFCKVGGKGGRPDGLKASRSRWRGKREKKMENWRAHRVF